MATVWPVCLTGRGLILLENPGNIGNLCKTFNGDVKTSGVLKYLESISAIFVLASSGRFARKALKAC